MANLKYQGNDFEEWFKAHYGTAYDGKGSISKTEGMSDADYAYGQNLLNMYQNQSKLTSDYNAAKDTLAQDKRDAEIAADVSMQRLQKYLPQQLAKQGLYGTGMSEDAYLKLQNNYQNTVSNIGKDYRKNLTDLESAYMTDMNTERQLAASKNEQTLDKYRELGTASYNEAVSALESGAYETTADIDQLLAQYKSSMSDQQYGLLSKYAEGYKTDIAKNEEFKARGMTSSLKFDNPGGNQTYEDGDDFDIIIDNQPYEVESAGAVSGDVVEWAAANGAGSGSVFLFDDEIYVNKNGTIYLVKPRNRKTSGSDYNHYIKIKKMLKRSNNTNTEPVSDKAEDKVAQNEIEKHGYKGPALEFSQTGLDNIKIWVNDKTNFNVQSGVRADEHIENYAKENIKKGTLFVYEDIPYIYADNGVVYEVEERTLSNTGYNKLIGYLESNK